MLKIVEFSKEG